MNRANLNPTGFGSASRPTSVFRVSCALGALQGARWKPGKGRGRAPAAVGNPWKRGRKTEEKNRGDAESAEKKRIRERRRGPPLRARLSSETALCGEAPVRCGDPLFFFFSASPRLRGSSFFLEDPPLPGVPGTGKTPPTRPAASRTPFQPRGEPPRKPPKGPSCTQNPEAPFSFLLRALRVSAVIFLPVFFQKHFPNGFRSLEGPGRSLVPVSPGSQGGRPTHTKPVSRE